MTRRLWTVLASIAVMIAGPLVIATPAHAAAPTVTLTCERTYERWDCTATPSGSLGSLQWYIAGELNPAFNNNIYWSRGCQPFQQIDVTVVYTDPTGAQASKTKTPMCWYVTP